MMNKSIRHCLLILSLLFSGTGMADNLVLIQGYLSDGSGWRNSGVASQLVSNGWADAGHLRTIPTGVERLPVPGMPQGGKRFYTIYLPTEAPLLVQERLLGAYIDSIRQQKPNEPIYFAGHSAGGILARLFMIHQPDKGIKGLMTIASPNLGSGLAETGIKAGNSPLSWFAPMVGANTLNRSQALYHDLVRERPGNLLFWLNRQQHPQASYLSVIHTADDVVAPPSQDLRNVAALRGTARSLALPGEHGLVAANGVMIANWLKDISSK
ncbi:MAG: alpha/beta fold hydrolase [Gammaproteobacteria bacterium]